MIELRLLNTESQDKADYLHNQLTTDINVPSTYWECAESVSYTHLATGKSSSSVRVHRKPSWNCSCKIRESETSRNKNRDG